MAPGREACGRGAPAAGHPSEGVALAEVSHAERAAGWRVAADRTCHNQAASTSLKGGLYGVSESTRIWTNYKEKLHLCRETWHLSS